MNPHTHDKIAKSCRNIKAAIKIKTLELFPRWQLHRLFEPFSGGLLSLVYLSKLSQWQADHRILKPDGSKLVYDDKLDLYESVLKSEKLDEAITYLEFGVASGWTFKWWVKRNSHPDSRFVGFDTFYGLPEGWGEYEKGAFSTSGQTPEISDSRCRFVKGIFQDTLIDALPQVSFNQRVVVHLDADLYSATLFVLLSLAKKLKKGDILIFDEFSSPLHEFRAFIDFVAAMSTQYQFLGCTKRYSQVIIKIL